MRIYWLCKKKRTVHCILFELYKPVYYANSNNILQNENTMDR